MAVQAAADETRWYSIVVDDGARIGHASREVRDLPDGREIVEAHVIVLQEPDQGPTRLSEQTTVREDSAGRALSMNEYSQVGRLWTRTEALIGAAEATITRQSRVDRRQVTVPLPSGVRFDNGEALLRGWDPLSMPPLEFQAFNLGALAVERVVIAPLPGAARDSEGRVAVLRKRYEGNELRAVSRLTLDRDGRIVEAAQPWFGTTLRLVPATREHALRRHPPYSALRRALVRSPFRISTAAMRGRIRYRFAFRDGIAFELPQTHEQRVAVADGGVTVDICADCGPGLAFGPSALAAALRPTPWLQSDHPRMRAIASPIARQNMTDTRRMELLAERVRQRLPRIDFTGHLSALDALDRGAGDCTESAVLLAALGRAAGIPTRVANGLVYSRELYHGVGNVFMPHSWVLAYVEGEWHSFDAALDGFDATHIALTIGDGDARSVGAASQLASLLQWQEMAEVRRRPES
jgi:transglutaminase-like putative cysteine protease